MLCSYKLGNSKVFGILGFDDRLGVEFQFTILATPGQSVLFMSTQILSIQFSFWDLTTEYNFKLQFSQHQDNQITYVDPDSFHPVLTLFSHAIDVEEEIS